LKVLELPGKLAQLADRSVFLAPATLRPETMYGQTNCFVLPDGDYGAFEMANDDVFIMTERSARGFAHQGLTKEWGKVNCLLELTGRDLLGLPLKAPNAQYERVYTLPLLTISMGKGTGVVTSVPSDAPDDYATLRELQEKPDFRSKFGITDEMVMPFQVVPIIEIPGYGNMSAVTMCERLGIKTHRDTEKLKQAKEETYLKGFTEGVMLVGEFSGRKVCEAKPLIREQMIERGDACVYWEPESLVVSRSGDECIVALTDQWYLTYGAPDWCENVRNHINNTASFNAYSQANLDKFNFTLGWLKEWACSREFGLGTQLPWDEKWVIESLSDSTIYMAYYTIAHLLQGEDNLDGLARPSPAGITPDQLTDEVFDAIFLGADVPADCQISAEVVAAMRKEFEYWYPMDLRVSAKDLIPNHLTMALYNHAEIWKDRPDLWPKSYYCNGHILVNAEKMSKSKGNFLMMKECVQRFSADATRFTCADAGDTLEDANYAIDTADNAVLMLFNEEEWIKEVIDAKAKGTLRSSEVSEWLMMDKAFNNEINRLIALTDLNFAKMNFRDGLQSGWFQMQLARDTYRDWSRRSNILMEESLVFRFIKIQTLLIAAICPHYAENIWTLLEMGTSVVYGPWPAADPEDKVLSRAYLFFKDTLKNFRSTKGKTKGKTTGTVYVADSYPEWKILTLRFMQAAYSNAGEQFDESFMKALQEFCESSPENKKQTKQIMQFAAWIKKEVLDRGPEAMDVDLPFNQKEVLESNIQYLTASLDLSSVRIFNLSEDNVPGPENKKLLAGPGQPFLFLE